MLFLVKHAVCVNFAIGLSEGEFPFLSFIIPSRPCRHNTCLSVEQRSLSGFRCSIPVIRLLGVVRKVIGHVYPFSGFLVTWCFGVHAWATFRAAAISLSVIVTLCFPTFCSVQHIFCENCVLQWLDRQNTCPLCRAAVANYDPKWRDGSTAKWPQIFWIFLLSAGIGIRSESLFSTFFLFCLSLSPFLSLSFSPLPLFLSLSLSRSLAHSAFCYFMPLFASQ